MQIEWLTSNDESTIVLFYIIDAVLLPDSGVCPDGKIKQGTLASVENYVKYCGG